MELTKNPYKEALLQEGILKGRNLELLSAIYESPSCEITGTQLAEIFGYKAFPPINAKSRHYRWLRCDPYAERSIKEFFFSGLSLHCRKIPQSQLGFFAIRCHAL